MYLAAPRATWMSRRSTRLLAQFMRWHTYHQAAGDFYNCRAGFMLVNGAVRSPSASWVSAARWHALTPEQQDKFAQVCSEFVVELRSKTDSLRVLLEKMAEYRQNGALLGWLLSCDDEQAYIFRAGKATKPWPASTGS